jgi:hypothetical protein
MSAALNCHSRPRLRGDRPSGGNPDLEIVALSLFAVERGVWVPAFAGMTARGAQ